MASSSQFARLFGVSSVNRSILRAAVLVSGAGIVVKLAATFKEVAVAGVYGRTDAMDAFLAAALIPSLLVNLIAESMNQALAPTLIRVREQEGRERAQQLLSSSMLWMCLLVVAASAAMALAARGFFPLIASHFGAAKLALSIRLFYGLLPVVLITGIATNCTSVLNTVDRFTLPALAPIAVSLSIIAGALTLGGRLGVWALVWSTLAGSLIHAALMAWMMQAHGYRFRLRWYGMDAATREVGRQYGPVLLSGVVASGGLLVDQSMAAMLAAGSVSALVYANRFVSVVLTLLAGALSTAIVPYFSRMIARRDWAGCRQTLRTWTWLMAAVSVPIAGLLIAGSHGLVRLALQRGAFGPGDTAVVGRVLAMYAIQIPFFVTSRVFYRFLVAMRRTDLVLYCGIVNLGLDVVLNLVLMRRYGVAGIALATSLWTVSTFFFLGYWARRLLRRAEWEEAQQVNSAPGGNDGARLDGGFKMGSKPAQYLLRIDDLCPTMGAERWRQLAGLIEEFRLRPILAIVPENGDEELCVSPADPGFWGQMRALQAAGATIALHGYRHVCSSRGRSLAGDGLRSEFAGIAEGAQRAWIHAGLAILRAHGLKAKVWVAPRHGFDANTLKALRGEGILALSDGLARVPFTRDGLVWIPQQLWKPREKRKGLWTICIHPNTTRREDVEELRAFLQSHGEQFTSVDRILAEVAPGPAGLVERVYAKFALWRIRARTKKRF